MSSDAPWVRRFQNVHDAIRHAEAHLPGTEHDEGENRRWRVIDEVGEFVQSDPEPVWEFICRWGVHPDEDLRMAIACNLIEYLLGCHFNTYLPLIEAKAMKEELFADTFGSCWKYDQSDEPENARKFDELKTRVWDHWWNLNPDNCANEDSIRRDS